MKIIHTADVHLDSPLRSLALRDEALRDRVQTATRSAFDTIVQRTIDEEAAALLIAGDLFDGAERSARTIGFLLNRLDRLRAAGVRVFCIKGNHDAENKVFTDLGLPDNVHVFDGRGGKQQLAEDVWVHGVSFADRHAPESLLGKFLAPVANAINIAMLHTSLAGSAGHDVYAPCTVAELAGMGFDYWALGHVHRRQVHRESPWIVMPGMPQGRDIGEAGPKSATLLHLADGIRVETFPTAAVEFHRLELDITGIDHADALRDHLRGALRALIERLESESAIVRLRLRGATALRWELLRERDAWRESVAQLAADNAGLWLETLSLDLDPPAEAGASATDELAALMAAHSEDPARRAAFGDEMETLLRELPPAVRARRLPDEAAAEALCRRLAEAGRERMLARMKGVDG